MLLVSLALAAAAIALYLLVPALQIHWTQPLPVYGLLVASVAAAVASRRRGALRWIAIAVPGLLAILLLAYTAVLSDLDRRPLAIAVGDRFPDLVLETSTNDSLSTAGLRGKSAALFVFYRGHW